MSALRIAKGMAEVSGARICVLDTEKESSNLYADVCEFDVLGFNPPFPADKYVKGIKLAETEGYGICIIDSASHEWAGEGGILNLVDKLTQASSSKNSYAAWNTATPVHNSFVEAILQSSMHVIVTLRSKVAYELVKNEKTGRTAPVKVGMAPITREGMDFEFTTWLDLETQTHYATAGKDRTKLFSPTEPVILSEETGRALLHWLNNVKEEEVGEDSRG